MRTLIFILAAQLTALAANAQKISGLAKDATGSPVTGATISLLKDTGMAVIKLGITDQKGVYHFSGIPAGAYRVSASYVGHGPSTSDAFTLNGNDVNVPELTLSKVAGNMQGVTVTAKKPVVEVKADKTILNVEGTINAVGSDALDLLRKSPGVTVDKDENLGLSGKNGVQVYVDGRPSPLAGADLANFLKSLPSAQIEAIELITNPSAKYEAAGNAGIINIRLKKNKSFGTNGSVNAGFNYGVTPKYNGGFSLNYRNKNVNLYGNYNYANNQNESRMSIVRELADTLFDQRSTNRMMLNSHNFKTGIDYTLNKQSSIGAMINGNFADPTVRSFANTSIIYKPTNTVDRILSAQNYTDLKRHSINYNLNYNYTNANGKSLVINADHGRYDLNSNQLQPNNYYNAAGNVLLNSVVYQMISPTDIQISSLKADWEQNFAKGKLGFGGKTAFITTDNDFQRYNVFDNNDKQLDKERSNRFKYTENVHAGYINYNRQLKGIMIQAGLRAEQTVAEGKSNGLKSNGSGYDKYDSSFTRSYTDLFPSAAITFNKNPMSQFGISYSRRIDRPAYQDLNPFEFKIDEYTFQKGNINLQPQYTNSVGLTHTYKYKLNTRLNYSRVKDLFTQLIDTAEGSKAFISKRNLATQEVVSLNISYPFQYKAYSLFANVSTNYSNYQADFGAGREVDMDAFGFNLFAQQSLKFAKTWTAELSGFYNAPTILQGNFKSRYMWSVDAGLQKQVMQGKATIKAAASDVFNTLKFRGRSEFAGQASKFTAKWESQQVKLSFNLRFGNNGVKAARQRNTGAEDENKRVQNGGGGIGIGQ